MALFAPTGQQWRPPRLGKAAIVSPYRGILRAQAWPKKRGQPTDPKAKARIEMFRLLQRLQKLLRDEEISSMREAIKNHNRTHRGQRGSAAIRFRDWQHQRLAGRGFAFDFADGLTVYPPGVARTASHLLDHIDERETSLATRTASEWTGLRPTGEAQLLVMNEAGDNAEWQSTE